MSVFEALMFALSFATLVLIVNDKDNKK